MNILYLSLQLHIFFSTQAIHIFHAFFFFSYRLPNSYNNMTIFEFVLKIERSHVISKAYYGDSESRIFVENMNEKIFINVTFVIVCYIYLTHFFVLFSWQ